MAAFPKPGVGWFCLLGRCLSHQPNARARVKTPAAELPRISTQGTEEPSIILHSSVTIHPPSLAPDNLFIERLWRSLKYEEVYLKAYSGGREARVGIGSYLEFYNGERPHQALGYRNPGEVFQEGQHRRGGQDQEVVLPSGVDTFPQVAADSLNLASSLSK
jgi:transposase InsO family protein